MPGQYEALLKRAKEKGVSDERKIGMMPVHPDILDWAAGLPGSKIDVNNAINEFAKSYGLASLYSLGKSTVNAVKKKYYQRDYQLPREQDIELPKEQLESTGGISPLKETIDSGLRVEYAKKKR